MAYANSGSGGRGKVLRDTEEVLQKVEAGLAAEEERMKSVQKAGRVVAVFIIVWGIGYAAWMLWGKPFWDSLGQ